MRTRSSKNQPIQGVTDEKAKLPGVHAVLLSADPELSERVTELLHQAGFQSVETIPYVVIIFEPRTLVIVDGDLGLDRALGAASAIIRNDRQQAVALLLRQIEAPVVMRAYECGVDLVQPRDAEPRELSVYLRRLQQSLSELDVVNE